MTELFLVGSFLFVTLFPGFMVFGLTLQILTSDKLNKKIDERLKDCGFIYSPTDEES